MMDYLILFYFLISTLPGIYLATKKYFLIIPNPKYNRFTVKLIYCVPALTSMTFISSLIPWSFYMIFFRDYTPFLVEKFTIYIALLCPLSAAILLIFILKKYVISTDNPPECQPNFMNHELYIFTPYARIKDVTLEYPKKSQKHKELDIGKQVGDLVLNLKRLNKLNYTTSTGEFVVNEEALKIFQKNNLTGYRIQPVLDSKKSSSDSSIRYHQIIPLHTMPPFSPKTIVRSGTTSLFSLFYTFVLNDLYYYNSSVMDVVFDFNLTSEYLGSNEGVPYLPQRLWIVSKKAMRILLKEFGQQRRAFIPIILVDDEKSGENI